MRKEDGAILAPINITETGNGSTGSVAWTGTTEAGDTYPGGNSANSADWISASAGETGRSGAHGLTDTRWASNNVRACDELRTVFCFEQ